MVKSQRALLWPQHAADIYFNQVLQHVKENNLTSGLQLPSY